MQVLKVSGTHFECGQQIGKNYQEQIQKALEENKNNPAPSLDWDQTIEKSKLYWEETVKAYPQIIEEIKGVAEGANVETIELFTYLVEELWAAPSQKAEACSDIVLTSPLTDGRIIVGHNNDLPVDFLDKTFPIEWTFDDGSSMFTVGPLGFYVSSGVNSFGISLTGNELTPTDNKIGIPRAVIARAILTAKNIEEAINIATDQRRASSYNNVISTKDRAISIEGSGTSFEIIEPKNGYLAHTNHYTCPSMIQFEGKENNVSSISRLTLANDELQSKVGQTLAEKDLETILRSHIGKTGDDNSLCRHSDIYPTVFSITIDFGSREVNMIKGNPCQGEYEKVWEIPLQ